MSDVLQAIGWTLVLGLGVTACVWLRRRGVPATYVRDLLHVGAGVWVLGWNGWHGWSAPVAIVWGAVFLTSAVPFLAGWVSPFASFRQSVSSEEEGWAGLVLYALSFALLTTVGLRAHRFASAAALWALCLGDGIGGAVGRRFGKHFFSVPGGKQKSLEGAIAVALAAADGAFLANLWFDERAGLGGVALLGVVAAVAEGLSPRSTDNLLVPLAVWAAARFSPLG